MSHIELAKEVILNKKSKRHFNQKTFKKAETVKSNVVNVNKVKHDQMQMFASQWWNRWSDNKFIHNISKNWLKAGTPEKRTTFLRYEYLKWSKVSPELKKVIPQEYFIQQFNYCIPHFYLKWIEEENKINRKYIKGDTFNGVLSFLSGKKSVKIERIYDHFVYEFEATIKSSVTKLIKKGYIKEISINDKLFYAISDRVKCNGGYYLENQ